MHAIGNNLLSYMSFIMKKVYVLKREPTWLKTILEKAKNAKCIDYV